MTVFRKKGYGYFWKTWNIFAFSGDFHRSTLKIKLLLYGLLSRFFAFWRKEIARWSALVLSHFKSAFGYKHTIQKQNKKWQKNVFLVKFRFNESNCISTSVHSHRAFLMVELLFFSVTWNRETIFLILLSLSKSKFKYTPSWPGYYHNFIPILSEIVRAV